MKSVYQTIILIVLIIAICFAGCVSAKKVGCPSWRVVKIDTIKDPHGYTVTLRRMNNFIKTTCYCNCLPDSVRVGAIINL